MKLDRAIELCQLPLDHSRSHIVKVDRHAVKHVLADHKETTDALKGARSRIDRKEETITDLDPFVAFVKARHEAEYRAWHDEQKKAAVA